ncbi:MAG TPA: aldo/keto reductase [Sphingomonadaceae bacterium]|nr:aldo/keto reductase [Sphingomonadaceae bacterium]
MRTTRLGRQGPLVSALGLGCMGMSDFYGPADDDTSLATLAHAAEIGVTLLDTGDFYGMGHNEMLIGRALRRLGRDRFLLSVKFGAMRAPDGGFGGFDASPAAMRNFLAYSLKRLGTDHIDIYRPARLDPDVPIEEVIGAIARMVEAGYVRHIGLSEVSAGTIRRAHAVHPIVDVQMEYSLMSRTIEREILPTVRELGIGVTAYGVLSRGLIAPAPPTGRDRFPRFQGEALAANRRLVDRLAALAAEAGITVSQLALAWVFSRDPAIVPLIGTRHSERLDEAAAVLDLQLPPALLARAGEIVSPDRVAGARYDPHQMEALDSERG